MDVNSINTSINNLNSSSSLQLERSSSTAKIDKTNSDGLTLSINDYNKKRDELSLDVQTINDGLAITKIAQNAIEKQKGYLTNIQDKLSNIDSFENKNDVKQSINEELKNFNQVAYQTKYKRENLLVVDRYDEKTSVEVNTQSQNFSMEKPNTATYANEIFEVVNNSDLNQSENLNAAVTKVESSYNQIQNTYEQFTELGNALEISARDIFKQQQDLYTNNQKNKERNFGSESADFTKSNITSNVGYLVASQANIVQEQSVKLLS